MAKKHVSRPARKYKAPFRYRFDREKAVFIIMERQGPGGEHRDVASVKSEAKAKQYVIEGNREFAKARNLKPRA